ncbi:MAG: YihY/virulence factor BrkB family protein [Vulcanimicrobiota bacterium]
MGKKQFKKITDFFASLVKPVREHRITGRWYLIIENTVMEFGKDGGFHLSAGIAYFAMFSMIPILLIVISVVGYSISSADAIQAISNFVNRLIPGQSKLILDNVRTIAEDRGKVGLLGLLLLTWSGRGIFLAMEYSINRVWGNNSSRSVISRNILAFTLIFILFLVVIIFMLISTISTFLIKLKIPVLDISLSEISFWSSLERWGLSTLLVFVIFLLLYKILPHLDLTFGDVLPGAVLATILYKILEALYIWYISNIARLSQVYGSIGGLLGIMLWFFISSIVLLLGAEFCYVYLNTRENQSCPIKPEIGKPGCSPPENDNEAPLNKEGKAIPEANNN